MEIKSNFTNDVERPHNVVETGKKHTSSKRTTSINTEHICIYKKILTFLSHYPLHNMIIQFKMDVNFGQFASQYPLHYMIIHLKMDVNFEHCKSTRK